MESCKEFVRRIVRSLTEWKAVRSLLGNCRSRIETRAASNLLGDL